MTPIKKMYWTRVLLGILAAFLSTGLGLATGSIDREYNLNILMNGLSVALLVYLISYYVFKAIFKSKVEKQQKFLTMGIGIYFFTWIASWVVLYSILLGPL